MQASAIRFRAIRGSGFTFLYPQRHSFARVASQQPPLWTMNWLKRAMGVGSSAAGAAPTVQQAAEVATEAVACYPDDVPFEEGPCTACDNPCMSHKQIPDYLKIDTESPLLGSMKAYKRHVLFQTPGRVATNWPPKLEEQEGSLAAELSAGAKSAGTRLGYRVLVTAVDIPAAPEGEGAESPRPPLLRAGEALILPDMVALGPLSADTAQSALEEFLATGEATAGTAVRQLGAWRPVDGASGPDAAGLSACILVCAHKLRDKRCGVAGPLLVEELQVAARKNGLQDKVEVLACSHVGGHKFAGNIVVYGAAGGHWYGRVKPCHADAVIETHVVGGRVIKELWRGRMDV